MKYNAVDNRTFEAWTHQSLIAHDQYFFCNARTCPNVVTTSINFDHKLHGVIDYKIDSSVGFDRQDKTR